MKTNRIILLAWMFAFLFVGLPIQAESAKNPVIWADVPDVSVIRVADTYYMSFTTMHMSPGLPILKSKNLVNWKMLGYAYDRLVENDAMNMENGRSCYGQGSWASSLRYHNGTYYVSTFSSTSGRTHVFRTSDIEKSDWQENSFAPSLHDSSLFFDDDGRVYMLYGAGNLRLVELEADLSGIKKDGFNDVVIKNASAVAGPRVGLQAEGSQVRKINGKYYVMNITWPGGGMRTQIIHRADKITGPYEGKVVLQDKGIAQGCLIDTPDGKWYAMLFQDNGAVGRSPWLIPVKWQDGWPVLGTDGKAPLTLDIEDNGEGLANLVASDEFDRKPGEPLPLAWQWNHNPDNRFWSIGEPAGYLRLTTGRVDNNVLGARNMLTQRTFGPESSATTKIEVGQMKDGDCAGLIVLQKKYGFVGVKMEGERKTIVMVSAQSDRPVEIESLPLEQQTVYFKINCDFRNRTDKATFYYSLNGQSWTKIGSVLQMSYTLPHFMGYRFGLFNFATKTAGGAVDFDYYHVRDTIADPDPNFYVFLSFGQSNMDGAGKIEEQDKTVDERFQLLAALDMPNMNRKKGEWSPAVPPLCRATGGIGPSDYFGRTMVANLPENIKVGVVNVSIPGCKIELFEKDTYRTYSATVEPWMTNFINGYDGNPYEHLVKMAKKAQQKGVIKGILLHQGESNPNDREWTNKVKGIYDNLIKDLNLNAEDVPLLAGETVNADQQGVCAGMNRIIAELPRTLPNSYVISSAGCTSGRDRLHFDSAGYREFGKRYAEKMLSLLGGGSASPLVLWYDKPAVKWEEALPVGNGRISAMVFGHPENERLQLNEGTLWAGGPYNPVNPEAKEALPAVRQLVNEGKYREAANLISAKVMAKPLGQMPYQTIGDLLLTFPGMADLENYRRELDIDTATTALSYTRNAVEYTREVFASAPDNVIVMRLRANKPGQISFSAKMKTPMKATVETEGNDTLVMRGQGGDASGVRGQIKYQTRVKVMAKGGQTTAQSGEVSVSGADEVMLLIAAATSYKSFDDVSGDPESIVKSQLASAAKPFATLYDAHLQDYQTLFHRVTLDLGQTEAAQLPTNERIRRFAEGNDPQLAALYYQYGRYLLISCSRPGGQPATLQGLWNQSTNPPWQSKYTININTEMNYWPAESGNLAECVEPLIDMVNDLTVTGSRTAREMYGARGWVVHHNTDLWRASAPIDGPNWGMWPTGGAWLCLHLWDRYEFSGDEAVLKGIYPVLKGASEFFLDTLQEDARNQWLVTNPSISPENGHPKGAAVCAGPTMDMQILRDLFANTIKAAKTLGVDEEFSTKLTATRSRLAPNQIGGSGQLQEWMEDWDMQAGEIHHRHVSHLYGLYPGRDINRLDTPELAEAVKKSLEIRGDKATGWATAWRIALWTHLGDGDHAYKILQYLISPDLTYPNMFDAHPPFQIDGNFGGAASVAEMIMQSRVGSVTDPLLVEVKPEIELLPALPKAWPNGSVKGLRARGGFEVDVQWKDGNLKNVTVRAISGGSCQLRYGAVTQDLKLSKGERAQWDGVSAPKK